MSVEASRSPASASEVDDWAIRARFAIDRLLDLRSTGELSRAHEWLTDDVELFHPEADTFPGPIRGPAAVVEFFRLRPRPPRPLEIIDVFAGVDCIVIQMRGQWVSLCSFEFDANVRVKALRICHAIGAEFGRHV